MWTEVTLCNASKSLMENLLGNLSDGTILCYAQYRKLRIMIARHEQELIIIVRRKVTASHSIDGCPVDSLKTSILLNLIRFYPKVGNGIQVLLVM